MAPRLVPDATTKRKEEYLYGLGPIPAERIRIERERGRLHKRMLRLRSYALPDSTAVDALASAIVYLDDAIARLKLIPRTWRPVTGVLGLTPVEAGSMVTVRPTFVNRYREIFPKGTVLRVHEVVGSRVACSLGAGRPLVLIHRTHVQVEVGR